MTGKPPKIKPVSAPTRPIESSGDGLPRALNPSSTMPHSTVAHHQGPLPSPSSSDSLAVMPVISVSTRPKYSTIDEFASVSARNSLENYWIPTQERLDKTDAWGIAIMKQRQYVAVADNHIVQVVRDPESGLFRATHARELHPSGPLLRPDSEGRLWHPLDDPESANPVATVFTGQNRTTELPGTEYSIKDFPPLMTQRIFAVSGVDAMMAHRSDIHPASLALLQDTARRFALDQKIRQFITQVQHSDPTVRAQADSQLQALLTLQATDLSERVIEQSRALLFEQSERAFELDCDDNTLQMRRIFPHLPKTIAQALWREASGADHRHLRLRPGMPRHMAEKTLVALREVRLARACEGIYLDAVASLDSDQLALQMLGQLDQWPRQIRIEIRLQASEGESLSAIGDARSPVRHILIRQHEGYVIQRSGIASPQDRMDLYAAVWRLLLPGQRQLLGVAQGGGAALRQLVRAQPLPSRQRVSELLGLAPVQVTAVPASAQYAQAGLRGGGDVNPMLTGSVVERVRSLYPQLADKELAAFVSERLGSEPSTVLARLETDLAILRNELAIWSAEGLSTQADSSQDAMQIAEQRQAREQFSAKLQDIWRRKSVSRWGYGDYHFSHHVDFTGELPRLSARFDYVTELILTVETPGARIGAFFDSFPNVQYLMVTGIKMEDFPSGIFQMRQLRQLVLDDCSLELSEATAEGVSRIETLTLLNLANNPLTVAPHVGFMTGLTELMLYNANLSSLPSGIDRLGDLRVMALQDNNISDVGGDLFDIPDTQDLYVGLLNNPLSDESMRRINQYLENSSMDRKVEIQTEETVSDVDSDSESSESGFSTGPDSD
ncbi:leucine-rich repeat domain-containing protein [Pseudomonas sp. S2_B03]